MANPSDQAELSTLQSQIRELTDRVVKVAEAYEKTPSTVASDLFAAERALINARRNIERAAAALT